MSCLIPQQFHDANYYAIRESENRQGILKKHVGIMEPRVGLVVPVSISEVAVHNNGDLHLLDTE